MAKNVQRESKFPGLMKNVPTSTQPSVPVHVHEHEYEQVQVQPKELRNKRVIVMLKPSMADKLDRCAKQKDVSKNSIVESLIEEYLQKEGF